jgi:Ca2+-binding RTX toxin-like protein
MAQPTAWTPIFSLPSITGGVEGAATTVLPDGRFISTWQDVVDIDEGPNIRYAYPSIHAQILNADGTAAAPVFKVNGLAMGNVGKPQVALLANGDFVIVYEQVNAAAGIHNLIWHRYHADGTSLGETAVARGTGSLAPSVTALGTGGFAITHNNAIQNSVDGIAHIIVSNEGSILQDRIEYRGDDEDYRGPTAVALPNTGGKYVTVLSGFHLDDGPSFGFDIRSSTGVLQRSFTKISDVTEQVSDNVAITTLDTQEFVVTWKMGPEIKARLFGFDGLAHGAEFVVGAAPGAVKPNIVALPNGHFAIVFHPGGQNIQVKIFNNSGIPTEGFSVPGTQSPSYSDPVLTILADGRFLIEWNSEYAVKAQIFDPRQQGADWTAGDEGQQYGGTLHGDHLRGGAGNDVFFGVGGADILAGNGGSDVLKGDAGDDLLEGGAGPTLMAGSEVERLQAATGSVAIHLAGSSFANTLIGNDAGNILNGGAGADTLEGGGGNDTYILDNAGDRIVETAIGGTDTAVVSLNFSLAGMANVEVLKLADGTTAQEARGGAGNDRLVGNTAFNILDGGAGADTMEGGVGSDVFVVDQAGDMVIEALGGGQDAVQTTISYSLASDAEIEFLTALGSNAIDLTGNAIANTLSGNTAANVLDGGAGADRLEGAGGNDTYIVDQAGDVVVEGAGGGFDTVLTQASYTLAADAEVEVLTATQGTAAFLTGNAFANAITGHAGADQLKGLAGDDVLTGGSGHDRLSGGLGRDVLTGDTGKDVFVFDTAVAKKKNANIDTIKSFSVKDDGIWLDNAIFTALGRKGSLTKPAKLKKDAFYQGSKAHDGDDRIVYNKKTGALSYDADGSGSKAAIKIATLTKNLKLTEKDFFVI